MIVFVLAGLFFLSFLWDDARAVWVRWALVAGCWLVVLGGSL